MAAAAHGSASIPIPNLADSDDEGVVGAVFAESDDDMNLQERIDATGAPATLPHYLQVMWMEFYETRSKTPMPTFDVSSDNAQVGIKPLDTHTATFGWFFSMQSGTASGEAQLYLKCRLCPPTSSPLRVSFMEKGKCKFKFANVLSHITAKHPDLLTAAQKTTQKAAAPAAASSAGEAAPGPSAGDAARSAKRPAPNVVDSGDGIINMSISKYAFRTLFAEMIVMGALPFTFSKNLGMAHFLGRLGLPSVPPSTAKRDVEKLHDSRVKVVIAAKVEALLKPMNVTADVGGEATATYKLTPKLQASADGVTSRSGAKLESMLLHGGSVTMYLGGQQLLRPTEVLIAMRHFITTVYDAASHAHEYADILLSHGITPEMIAEWVMDTTNTNPAILKLDPWKHTRWIGCYQHITDLTVEELMKCADFVAIFKPANEISEVRVRWKRCGIG